jgi:hypothetical protein
MLDEDDDELAQIPASALTVMKILADQLRAVNAHLAAIDEKCLPRGRPHMVGVRSARPRRSKDAKVMIKEQKIIRAKVGLLELAKRLGNVSQACTTICYSQHQSQRHRFKLETSSSDKCVLSIL